MSTTQRQHKAISYRLLAVAIALASGGCDQQMNGVSGTPESLAVYSADDDPFVVAGAGATENQRRPTPSAPRAGAPSTPPPLAAEATDSKVLGGKGKHAGRVLFLTNEAAKANGADLTLAVHLQSYGYTVELKTAAKSTIADAADRALVVISSTVSPAVVARGFRDLAVPLITWEAELYDDLGMTDSKSGSYGTQPGQRRLTPQLPEHPLAAGLRTTFTLMEKDSAFSFGRPSAAAETVFTLQDDPTRSAVFAYLRGDTMVGMSAPARRVGMFMTDNTASEMYIADGLRLFLAAVKWATEESTVKFDSDADGLSDEVETNTGRFVSVTDTGTDPMLNDTDEDGLTDGDEILGTQEGLDLRRLGCNPLRKDILLEYDWVEDKDGCKQHSHRPTDDMLKLVSALYSSSPLKNPDGSTGIHLIHDYGQGAPFTGGNVVKDAARVVGSVYDSQFNAIRDANIAANRKDYFHYVLMGHGFSYVDDDGKTVTNMGGNADNELRMHITPLCNFDNTRGVAVSIMHELGHNLNLDHGGDEQTNSKPNYSSIMNYLYSGDTGVDQDCDGVGDGVFAFSEGKLPDLNENALLESSGVCKMKARDWNKNGKFDSKPVAADINADKTLSVLHDHNDWKRMYFGRAAWLVQGLEVFVCPPHP